MRKIIFKLCLIIICGLAALSLVACSKESPDASDTTEEASDHEHQYIGTVIRPTVEKQGYTEYLCSVCGDCYRDNYVSALIPSEGLKYTSNGDGTCYVSSMGICQDTVVVISAQSLAGDCVTGIGDNAFYHCDIITDIEIPSTVTSIGDYAFSRCSSLTSIAIPDSVTGIGNGAFDGCQKLSSIEIPCNVTSIGNYVFSDCSGLTSIKIPDGVTSIGSYAFYYCWNLTGIKIPDGVTSIGSHAFWNCSGLTSIKIPSSVTSIGDNAFWKCSRLTSLTVETGNTVYHSEGNCIIRTGDKTLIAGCNNSVIPADGSVTSIGEYAFYKYSGLTSIEIPGGVTNIGEHAFEDCNGLVSIIIPNSVTKIGGSAFNSCSGLTSITIPDSVISIGDFAFCGCSGLTRVEIPRSVTEIGEEAFCGCIGLMSLTVASGNPDYHSDGNCVIRTGTKELVVGCKSSIIPKDGSVTHIGTSAFDACSELTSIIIPDGVTDISTYAFCNCSGLNSIEIPNSITNIREYVFRGCTGLKNIKFNGTKAQWLSIRMKKSLDDSSIITITCTDGVLDKDGKEQS